MKLVLTLVVCLFAGAAQSFALNCGDPVSGNVTLSADLVCNSSNGLKVVAHNTTINLNGHTISCLGAGFENTCQLLEGVNGAWYYGITSDGYSNVKVLGPGTIKGFTVNVSLQNGSGLLVKGTTLSGPLVLLPYNLRGVAVGVRVTTQCPIVKFGTPYEPAATIEANEIKGQTVGISISDSGCVDITGNLVHDINRAAGGAIGIGLYNSGHSKVFRNSVTSVGVNRANDSALYMWLAGANHNDVSGNVVTHNCGNGLWVVNSTHDNNIHSNTIKDNGVFNPNNYSCQAPAKTYYDILEFSNGAGNVWNTNNACNTQNGAQIPVGVCKANE